MAVSAIATPVYFSPAYNPLKFIYDSTNKNNEGFKYVFDVYESGTANKIGERKVLPRPTDGYGEIDLSKLLQSQVTHDFNLSTTEDTTAPNSFYKYDVKVGEEYVTVINYTASVADNGAGYVEITATHAFQVGDRVVIAQADGGVANPNLEGLFIVVNINTTVSFTVNSLFADVTDATINGAVRYADNRKTIVRDLATSNNNYVFNGVRPWTLWRTYSEAPYILSSATDKFLTDMPSTYWITPTQNIYVNLSAAGTTTGRMYFENDGGDILYYTVNASGFVVQANVGASANPSTVVSGTAGHIKSDTEYYDVWYTNAAGTQHSQKYRLYIDRRCSISDYEIYFLDRMGTINSFSFQLRAYERGTVTRDTYNKDIEGSVPSSTWTYGLDEFGLKTFTVNEERTIELNSNFMTEEMSDYFAQLVTSPLTYIKNGSNYEAVIVTDSGYELSKERNKKLIRKTITVKLANQNVING
jgi:hypothetical protein